MHNQDWYTDPLLLTDTVCETSMTLNMFQSSFTLRENLYYLLTLEIFRTFQQARIYIPQLKS